jgi:hypothetical protein
VRRKSAPGAADEGYQHRASELTTVMQRRLWWQTAVIYQIYPRSFQDIDGDGIGDLRGITQRLPYLVELGVDAVWLSPIFRSPMADFGYDISDYTDIDPLFGSLDDFDELLAAAHSQGLKVILDLVPNHTSDQHPWFLESRASRRGSKRDWYIWRDPGRPTIGCLYSAAAPGNTIVQADSITITPFSPPSRISIGVIPRSDLPSTRQCASGFDVASTDSASTSSGI